MCFGLSLCSPLFQMCLFMETVDFFPTQGVSLG